MKVIKEVSVRREYMTVDALEIVHALIEPKATAAYWYGSSHVIRFAIDEPQKRRGFWFFTRIDDWRSVDWYLLELTDQELKTHIGKTGYEYDSFRSSPDVRPKNNCNQLILRATERASRHLYTGAMRTFTIDR